MADNSTSDAPPLVEQAKQQAHQAAEQGKQAVQQGKEMAGGLMDRARETVKTQIGTQKNNAATGLNDVAQALLLSSNHLQEQGQGGVAHYADAAAEKITSLSGYLRESDVEEVLDQVQSFARQQPALFLGGAVLLGVVAARFLKSSSPDGGTGGGAGAANGSNSLLPVPVSSVYDTGQGTPNDRADDGAPRTSDAT